MAKSVIGITIANFAIIIIVVLNNTGQGWEVPAETMTLIVRCTFILFAAVLFTLICFFISYRQFIKSHFLFKFVYLLSVIICLSSISFMFFVDAFQGQFWYQGFPAMTFLISSISLNIMFFIALMLLLYKHKKK